MKIALRNITLVFNNIFEKRTYKNNEWIEDDINGKISTKLLISKDDKDLVKHIKEKEADFFQQKNGTRRYGETSAAFKDGAEIPDKNGVKGESEEADFYVLKINQKQTIRVRDAKTKEIIEAPKLGEESLIKPNATVNCIVELMAGKNKEKQNVIRAIITVLEFVENSEMKHVDKDYSDDWDLLDKVDTNLEDVL